MVKHVGGQPDTAMLPMSSGWSRLPEHVGTFSSAKVAGHGMSPISLALVDVPRLLLCKGVLSVTRGSTQDSGTAKGENHKSTQAIDKTTQPNNHTIQTDVTPITIH